MTDRDVCLMATSVGAKDSQTITEVAPLRLMCISRDSGLPTAVPMLCTKLSRYPDQYQVGAIHHSGD